MQLTNVSREQLKRLPIYLDYLKSLPEDSEIISATAIAKALGLGDVQVRKDLAKVSCAGRRGTGRSREELLQDIEGYLDLATKTGAVVVGAGKLGCALLDYTGFEKQGLNILAGFDIAPGTGRTESGKPVYPMNRLAAFCRHYDVLTGIIAVPADSAQQACDSLVACGVRAIWNFAPAYLKVPDHVALQSENPAVSLTALRMQIQPAKED